jgi:hypothetical protein
MKRQRLPGVSGVVRPDHRRVSSTIATGAETGRVPAHSDMRVPVPLTVAAFTANFDRFAVGPILVTIAAAMHTPLSSTVALASATRSPTDCRSRCGASCRIGSGVWRWCGSR